jgi:hypothetical protein
VKTPFLWARAEFIALELQGKYLGNFQKNIVFRSDANDFQNSSSGQRIKAEE